MTTALFRALAFSQKKAVWRCASHRTLRIRATDIPGIHFETRCASGGDKRRRLPPLWAHRLLGELCESRPSPHFARYAIRGWGLALGTLILATRLAQASIRIGAPVVYRQQQVSTCPTADARDVHPAERGEYYYYTVINYLRVAEVMADGRIIAVARNNKRLCFRPNDSGLRKARLAERLIYRPRFPRFGDNSSASR